MSPIVPIGGVEGNVSLASQSDGSTLVAWCGQMTPDGPYFALGQLFDGHGALAGPVISLSSGPISPLARPEVAVHPDGGFVVAWDNVQLFSGLWLRRLNRHGLPLGPDRHVTSIPSAQRPVLGVAANGSIVVDWDTFTGSTWVRAFDSSGAPVAPESQANLLPFGGGSPALTVLDGQGRFVVAWSGHPGGPNPAPSNVFARLYLPQGVPAADPFVVNTDTEGSQGAPAVVTAPDGGFTITWSSYQPGPASGTWARHYDAAGAPLGASSYVQSDTAGDPRLLALPGGDRLLVWYRNNAVFARRLDPGCVPRGPAVRVSPRTPEAHWNAAASVTPSGFAVAWHSEGGAAPIAAWFQAFTFASRAAGDFDANGRADVAFRHASSGEVGVWLMDGLTRLEERLLAAETRGPEWRVEGVADFNADGAADLLWRHAAADLTELWLMKDHELREVVPLPELGARDPSGWHVEAVGDFDADRRPDLLWRHPAARDVILWMMAGPSFSGSAYRIPAPSDPAWRGVGAADFDGNGTADIAWHHATTGAITAWLLEARWFSPTVLLEERPFVPAAVTDTNWRPVAVADYDGDGGSDLLWQRQGAGTLVAWKLDGLTRVGASFLTPDRPADPAWQVVGPR